MRHFSQFCLKMHFWLQNHEAKHTLINKDIIYNKLNNNGPKPLYCKRGGGGGGGGRGGGGEDQGLYQHLWGKGAFSTYDLGIKIQQWCLDLMLS
jgi:hypothetical protein